MRFDWEWKEKNAENFLIIIPVKTQKDNFEVCPVKKL